jgi:hypothetical protein
MYLGDFLGFSVSTAKGICTRYVPRTRDDGAGDSIDFWMLGHVPDNTECDNAGMF